MALSTSTIQPTTQPETTKSSGADMSGLLSMIVLSVYAANKSKKQFRKLKRRYLWTALKMKLKSLFSFKKEISNRTLVLILLGVAFLALLIINPWLALIVALVALILILTNTI